MNRPIDTAADAPRACFIAAGLDVLGERWALLALREMSLGVHRFDQIARNTGASRDILTGRLRTLESRGVIERVQYSERPARYEYHLTDFRSRSRAHSHLTRGLEQHLDAGRDAPRLLPAQLRG
jgi:DNA-binding HxlR family transcriptional regulator